MLKLRFSFVSRPPFSMVTAPAPEMDRAGDGGSGRDEHGVDSEAQVREDEPRLVDADGRDDMRGRLAAHDALEELAVRPGADADDDAMRAAQDHLVDAEILEVAAVREIDVCVFRVRVAGGFVDERQDR